MKKIIALVAISFSLSALATAWRAPITVAPIEADVVVRQVTTPTSIELVSITIRCTDPMMLRVAWRWLDAAGNQIKQGTDTIREAELEQLFQLQGTSVAAIKQVFLTAAAISAQLPDEPPAAPPVEE